MKRYFALAVAILILVAGVAIFRSARREPPLTSGSAPPPNTQPPVVRKPEPEPATPPETNTAPPTKASPPPPPAPRPTPPPPPAPAPQQPVSTPPAERPPNRVTSRALLLQGENEEPGYGLYSYLVFGLRPARSDTPRYARYIKALEAYLELEEASSVRRYVPQDAINVTYLPVRDSAPTTPAALLETYDYSRAQRLLALTTGESPDGPFLISARQPLSRAAALPAEHIFQDLSTVPPDLVRLWVKHFIEQAAQERFWESKSRDEFILGVRTYIARGGNEVGSLSAAFASVIWQFSPRR